AQVPWCGSNMQPVTLQLFTCAGRGGIDPALGSAAAQPRAAGVKELPMLRSLLRPVVGIVALSVAAPVWAADSGAPEAPSAAVAAAWPAEGVQSGVLAKTVNVLLGSYGALQAVDMMSTIKARQMGAREVNPLMGGSIGQAAA